MIQHEPYSDSSNPTYAFGASSAYSIHPSSSKIGLSIGPTAYSEPAQDDSPISFYTDIAQRSSASAASAFFFASCFRDCTSYAESVAAVVDQDQITTIVQAIAHFNSKRLSDLLKAPPVRAWLQHSTPDQRCKKDLDQIIASLELANRTLLEKMRVGSGMLPDLNWQQSSREQSSSDLERKSPRAASVSVAFSSRSSHWMGEFQPMVLHEGADGSEQLDPLPEEPEAPSRVRPVRRT